ncbi:MAG: hypothetical protein H6R07_1605 [Proteobacteria bacterium]|nr:hypothetical protein [Pseudomonadota bacterium]
MAGDEALDVVSFTAGGYRFAVEARQIDHMLDHVPATVMAIEALLGQAPDGETGPRRRLQVGTHCIEVGEPVELRAVPAELIHALPALVAARTRLKGIRALVLEAGKPLLLVDLRAVLAQQAG